MGGLRTASAVIGGIGALVGIAKGLPSFAVWMFLSATLGVSPVDPAVLLFTGSDGGIAVFSMLGMAGVGLVIGVRLRAGAWLMLAGAAGVAASVAAYALLLPVTTTEAAEFMRRSPEYPPVGYYVASLPPVPLLLIAAASAFLACSRSSS